MYDSVTIDEMKYQERLAKEQAENDFIIKAADELSLKWKDELDQTGRIEGLGWDLEEVRFEMSERGIGLWSLLQAEADEMVSADPESYKPEPDYDLNWD